MPDAKSKEATVRPALLAGTVLFLLLALLFLIGYGNYKTDRRDHVFDRMAGRQRVLNALSTQAEYLQGIVSWHVGGGGANLEIFVAACERYLSRQSAAIRIVLLTPDGTVSWALPAEDEKELKGHPLTHVEQRKAIDAVIATGRRAYTPPFDRLDGTSVYELFMPVVIEKPAPPPETNGGLNGKKKRRR
ncbi:MAG: hypothetical protein M5R36_15880 [Deltaproteobacteria bacterium]|nr:hypothetical protein [Deltaproteobacteria bacterium]